MRQPFGRETFIRNTWTLIWDKWLPESGLKVLAKPFFVTYGPNVNGTTGEGGLEISVSVQPPA